MRRGELIGAVRTAELLEHFVGGPGELERDVEALARIFEPRVGCKRKRNGKRRRC